jgi:uncharacterized protein (DUF2236 family)
MPRDGIFPPDAVIRRVDGELVLLLGGGRALLLQLAHPLVARGVAEHSDFRTDPLRRLQKTLAATHAVVFGTGEQAEQAGAHVAAVHAHVRGPGYRASEPALLLWVHATLVDTALRVHRRFLRPLRPADAERYYQESATVAEVFGLPRAEQPADLAEFRSYFRRMVTELSGLMSDESRRLGHRVLYPRLPVLVAPVTAGFRELTIGLLPAPLRRAYGLRWDPARQLALNATALATRATLPWVPPTLRRVPDRAVWPVAS